MKNTFYACVTVLLLVLGTGSIASATLIGGIEFPDGSLSFADSVYSYNLGTNAHAPQNDPNAVLGIPDFGVGSNPYLFLGSEGELVVEFTDNFLTTSGTATEDLWIFEIGSWIEPTNIFISSNAIDWISVGTVNGGTAGIDIDSFIGISGVTAGTNYNFVKVVDVGGAGTGYSAGADIDAIGVISSAGAPVPEPATMLLFGTGLIGLVAGRIKRKKM